MLAENQDVVDGEITVIDSDVIDETSFSIIAIDNQTPIVAVTRSLAMVKAINTMIDHVFVKEIHYGSIPGVKKPTLLLPGIETVMGLLSLHEEFIEIEVVRKYDADSPFFYYEFECVLKTIGTNIEVGRGVGVAHSRESIYHRAKGRVCPDCDNDSIVRSGFVPRNAPPGTEKGWWCTPKKGGCGSNFDYQDKAIQSQNLGKELSPQVVWDNVNNVKKKAKKRALSDAVKRVGMLSSRFTVDVEDMAKFTDGELGLDKTEANINKSQANKPPQKKTTSKPPEPPVKVVPKNADEGFLNTQAAKDKLNKWLRDKDLIEGKAYQFILDHYKVAGFGKIAITDETKFYEELNKLYTDFAKPAAPAKKKKDEKPKIIGTLRKVEIAQYDGKKFIFTGHNPEHPNLEVYVWGRTEMQKLVGEKYCRENGFLTVTKGEVFEGHFEIEPIEIEYELRTRKNSSGSNYGQVTKITPRDLEGEAITDNLDDAIPETTSQTELEEMPI